MFLAKGGDVWASTTRCQRSIEDPNGFWGEAAEAISWYKKWDKVLDASNPPFYRWFPGAS